MVLDRYLHVAYDPRIGVCAAVRLYTYIIWLEPGIMIAITFEGLLRIYIYIYIYMNRRAGNIDVYCLYPTCYNIIRRMLGDRERTHVACMHRCAFDC